MSSMTLNQNQIKRGSTRRGSKHTEISKLGFNYFLDDE